MEQNEGDLNTSLLFSWNGMRMHTASNQRMWRNSLLDCITAMCSWIQSQQWSIQLPTVHVPHICPPLKQYQTPLRLVKAHSVPHFLCARISPYWKSTINLFRRIIEEFDCLGDQSRCDRELLPLNYSLLTSYLVSTLQWIAVRLTIASIPFCEIVRCTGPFHSMRKWGSSFPM